LKRVRGDLDQHGILLVFDEVICASAAPARR